MPEPARDLVIVLGAGLSAYAGYPVMSRLKEESHRLLAELGKSLSPDSARSLCPAYQSGLAFRDLADHIAKRNQHVLGTAELGNMEAIYSAVEVLRESSIDCIRVGHRQYNTSGLADQIAWWLWEVYRQLGRITAKSIAKTYFRFVDTLKPFLNDRGAILTTNYDLLPEYFAFHSGACFDYGLDGYWCSLAEPIQRGERAGTDLLTIWLDPNTQNDAHRKEFAVIGPEEGHPLLCKLHGSVNFFHLDDRPGEAPLFVFSPEVAAQGQRIGSSVAPQDDVPVVLVEDAPSVLRLKYPRITPAIIPPTYAKLRGYEWLRSIWSQAFRAVQQASTILFIGYSLPASDGFMRAMFQAALATRTHEAPPKSLLWTRPWRRSRDIGTSSPA